MFERCLISTDFTDGLQKLVYFVSDLAKAGFKEIVFCHVVPLWEKGDIPRIDSDKVEQIRQKFAPALENIPSGVKVSLEIPSGQPLDNLKTIAKNHASDLIVVGAPIRNAWQEKIFGSTTMGLVKSLDIPLLIFRPQLISVLRDEELSIRCQNLVSSLLMPYADQNTMTQYLLTKIKQRLKDGDRQSLDLYLVSIVDNVARDQVLIDNNIKQAKDKIQQIKIELDDLVGKVETEVKMGEPITQIFEAAYEHNISAVAIAADNDQGLLQWTSPSFTQEILHRCWFPLLFFGHKA